MRKLLILYASQTGLSQETAERIAREGRQRHFVTECSSMLSFPREQLPEQHHLVVFVCSVTGQGEEPDSMKVCEILILNYYYFQF
jgi:sulfite reductase alpha subunit-like flavoprotein